MPRKPEDIPAAREQAGVASLDLLPALVDDPQRFADWVAQRPELMLPAMSAYASVRMLEKATEWDTEELLRELGCRTKTMSEFDRDEDTLPRCAEYLSWISGLVDEVASTCHSRRRLVSGLALLFEDADADLAECKRVVEGGEWPPSELIRLGEIERALEACRLELNGWYGDRARRVDEELSFDSDRPHIGSETYDSFCARDRSLTSQMRDRIRDHLDICDLCADYYGWSSEQRAA